MASPRPPAGDAAAPATPPPTVALPVASPPQPPPAQQVIEGLRGPFARGHSRRARSMDTRTWLAAGCPPRRSCLPCRPCPGRPCRPRCSGHPCRPGRSGRYPRTRAEEARGRDERRQAEGVRGGGRGGCGREDGLRQEHPRAGQELCGEGESFCLNGTPAGRRVCVTGVAPSGRPSGYPCAGRGADGGRGGWWGAGPGREARGRTARVRPVLLAGRLPGKHGGRCVSKAS